MSTTCTVKSALQHIDVCMEVHSCNHTPYSDRTVVVFWNIFYRTSCQPKIE